MTRCERLAPLRCFAAAALCAVATAAAAQNAETDKSLHRYSVQIHKTRVIHQGTLNGIYLGNGAVLTAAHVVGRWHLLKELHVRMAGQMLPAAIVKEGSVDTIDLTVLSIEDRRLPVSVRLRRNPVCREAARIGQEVVVVAMHGTARSRVLSPLLVAEPARARFGTVIADVPIAMSGTGVFDADRRCLLGIISRKVTRVDAATDGSPGAGKAPQAAKYFVPAATIAGFLPAEFRF